MTDDLYGWDRCTHEGIGQIGCPTCDPDKGRVILRLRRQDNIELRAEVAKLRAALRKVDAIRDSIVGTQTFNWSEHAYPLVAALNEAGYPGAGHEIASKNMGTLIEQIIAAEAEIVRLKRELQEALAMDADEALEIHNAKLRADVLEECRKAFSDLQADCRCGNFEMGINRNCAE